MATETRKTDNKHLGAKLALRRYFLDKYHSDGAARVLDCCQGEGYIWRALRQSHMIAGYWGLDRKPKTGRIQADSARILQLGDLDYDVFDVDTYGSPWNHWKALLEFGPTPITVFLTSGRLSMGNCEQIERDVLGLGHLKVPATIIGRLRPMVLQSMFAVLPAAHGKMCAEVMQAETSDPTKYFGVRLVRSPGVENADHAE